MRFFIDLFLTLTELQLMKLFRFFSVVSIVLFIACSKQTKVVDEPDYWTFSVMNILEEDVSVTCSINSHEYVINVPKGQSYSYQQDLGSGFVASDKIPVFMSDHVIFSTSSGIVLESNSKDHFQKMWTKIEPHHLCLKISNELLL